MFSKGENNLKENVENHVLRKIIHHFAHLHNQKVEPRGTASTADFEPLVTWNVYSKLSRVQFAAKSPRRLAYLRWDHLFATCCRHTFAKLEGPVLGWIGADFRNQAINSSGFARSRSMRINLHI